MKNFWRLVTKYFGNLLCFCATLIRYKKKGTWYLVCLIFLLFVKYFVTGCESLFCSCVVWNGNMPEISIFWIIRGWSLFCSVWVYISHFHCLHLLLVKLGLKLSAFWFFMFLHPWLLVFSFSVLCFEFNIISKDLIQLITFV